MFDLVKMAVRNVGKRKKRAALTMIGIFIGIAAVVSLVSLGQGLSDTINAQFEKVGADKLLIQPKDPGLYGGEQSPGALDKDDKRLIEKVSGVSLAAGYFYRPMKIEFDGVQKTVFVPSIPDDAREAELVKKWFLIEAESGRELSHKDKKKAMIGYNVAYKNALVKNVEVGQKILVEGVSFEVVGVIKRVGDPTLDGGVLISEPDIRELLNESNLYTQIVAQAVGNPDVVAESVEKRLRRSRGLDEGKEDFRVQSSIELIESFNAVFNIIQVVFVGIAAISLLVGGIGIANVMFTAVLERTREIGVMKAIGARNKDVMLMFLVESGFLGLVGGIIGILIGIGISKVVEIGANTAFGPGTIYASYSPFLIVGMLVFSVGLGALSGVLPARRASKLKPVEALRYE
jgi:putative ABC transport system permease protein